MSSSDPARPAWATFQSPSLDELEVLAGEGFAALPEEFRTLIGDVEIRVADFPEEQVLDDLGIETEFDLLGLFQGTGLAHGAGDPFHRATAQPHLALPTADFRLLGRARGNPRGGRHPCPRP